MIPAEDRTRLDSLKGGLIIIHGYWLAVAPSIIVGKPASYSLALMLPFAVMVVRE